MHVILSSSGCIGILIKGLGLNVLDESAFGHVASILKVMGGGLSYGSSCLIAEFSSR